MESVIIKEFTVPTGIESDYMRERWSFQTFSRYATGVNSDARVERTSSFDKMTGHTATYTKDDVIHVLTSIQPTKDKNKMLISEKKFPAETATIMDKITYCDNGKLKHSPFKNLSNK